MRERGKEENNGTKKKQNLLRTHITLMKDHVSVILMLKKLPELLNQLQASRDEMYNTGARRAQLPWK